MVEYHLQGFWADILLITLFAIIHNLTVAAATPYFDPLSLQYGLTSCAHAPLAVFFFLVPRCQSVIHIVFVLLFMYAVNNR